MERDPLKVFRKCVLPHGCISEEDLTLLEEQIDEEMEQAVAFADKSPDVDPNEFAGMVYAQEGSL
jgi:TPP-dependent pyruvate/acetoin dehydrogenase alpha subunit